MKLGDLIGQFRTLSNDKVQPYFWSDDEVKYWLNEAQREAVVRGRLLRESSDPDICRIEFVAGQSELVLSPLLYEITSCIAYFDSGQCALSVRLVTTEYMDRTRPDWRAPNRYDPNNIFAMQEETFLRVSPALRSDGYLILEGYRLPKEDMDSLEDDEPEIFAYSHPKLIQWALHKAFSIPDTEFFDASRSALSLADFTRYFGESPDSNLRRSTREDLPQTNVKAYF